MGILGGTFNPVHLGHLRMAEEASELLDLEVCYFVPAWVPPHKPQAHIVGYSQRWRMLELATEGNSRFALSDLERRLSGKSYTVVSLKRFRQELHDTGEPYFLLGQDAFLDIHNWWHYRKIFELATLAIFSRPGFDHRVMIDYLHEYVSDQYIWNRSRSYYQHPHLNPIIALETTRLAISSSKIRKIRSEGRSIRYLVPEPVERYIDREDLYVRI